MTSNYLRVTLWAILAVALWLNYEAWVADYGKPGAPIAQTARQGGGEAGSGLGANIPQAPGSTSSSGAAGAGSAAGASSGSASSASAGTAQSAATAASSPAPVEAALAAAADAAKVHVRTDVLDVTLSLKGGTLIRADLLKYPLVKGKPAPVVLENHENPQSIYLLQSGLTGPDDASRPTHLATFTSPSQDYRLASNADVLRVPLTWTNGHGVTVTKTFVFRRGHYAIGLDQTVDNRSGMPWQAAAYAQLLRYETPSHGSMFSYSANRSFHGPAIYDGTKYRTLNITKADDQHLHVDVTGGWMAAPQHHFVSAVIPPDGVPYQYTLGVEGNEFDLAMAGPM
ncbi:MAG: membrane protein insertase YidC, partial [Steroidobacteraceae bacterium]